MEGLVAGEERGDREARHDHEAGAERGRGRGQLALAAGLVALAKLV